MFIICIGSRCFNERIGGRISRRQHATLYTLVEAVERARMLGHNTHVISA